jgi:hypothetical protein
MQLHAPQLELRDQKREHRQLFHRQKESFRSECDRICAETEQVKALLAVKMTEGRGFIEAAASLLTAEIIARDSHDGRQKRRENTLLSDVKKLNDTLQKGARYVADAAEMADNLREQVVHIDEL